MVLSADGDPKPVVPTGVLQVERVEGPDGGRQLSAAIAQDGDEPPGPSRRRLLHRMLELIAAPLRGLIVWGYDRHHLIG